MRMRQALRERQLSLGSWVQIGHPACGEIFARAGLDWVCVDLEHGVIDLETMAHIFRGLAAFDCTPVARLPINDPVWIHRTLDAGARALIIPMVNTAEEAEAAVSAAKYPPRGTRGFGYSRASNHGMDFDQYINSANDEIAMIMQIEHKDAIGNLDAILAVPDVDGLLIGPLDLSGSMGVTGQLDHPDVVAALSTYLAACDAHSTAAGTHIVRPTAANITASIDAGYTLIALGMDNVFIDQGITQALKAAGRGQ